MPKTFSIKMLFKSLLNILHNKLSVFLLIVTILNYFISWHTSTSSEVLTIFTITFLTSLSEVYQDGKREDVTKKLRKHIKAKMRVVKDRKLVETRNTKRGDIVFLQSGDRVLSDVLLFNYFIDEYINLSTMLMVDESIMTGESFPVIKVPIDIVNGEGEGVVRLKDLPRKCVRVLRSCTSSQFIQGLEMVNINDSFLKAGSFIHQGSMFGIVSSGKKKAGLLHGEKNTTQSNIVTQARYFSDRLVYVVVVFCMVVFMIVFYKKGNFLESLKISITLALTVMPEGLDASVKVVLLFMSRRLMENKVFVNNYLKLEKLGNIDVICLDKTGTLTYNKQRLDDVLCVAGDDYLLSGIEDKKELYGNDLFFTMFRYCNEVIKVNDKLTGDPLDLALIKSAIENRAVPPSHVVIQKTPFCPIKKTIEMKMEMNGNSYCLVKGATENVLNSCEYILINNDKCIITDEIRTSLDKQIDHHCSMGKRIIGCAYRINEEESLIFMCIVTFIDPPRRTVKSSIEWCRKNNIEITVITGDSLLTTKSVCESIGLYSPTNKQQFVRGDEIESFNAFDDLCFVYRAEPMHKLRIIEHYKNKGKSVLMTGDGLNDIMAMRQSCVSMAMGSGSYFCKELSDIIVLDDNFDNIVECIRLGRKGTHNIFCLFKYLISSNLGELVCVLLSFIFDKKECLSTSNLLLINLITDGLPVIVICFNEGDASRRKERITVPIILRCIMIGLYIGISTFFVHKNSLQKGIKNGISSQLKATTESTIFIIICEMINTLNNINLRKSVVVNPFWRFNRYILPVIIMTVLLLYILVKVEHLRILFTFSDISTREFGRLLVLTIPVLVIDELFKVIFH